ncbi:MAG: zinc-binding protein [Chloroflexi bacterium]|nr:zinc-binding protein [Chloroflexota bacterium]
MYTDKTLTCRDCGATFTFTVGEQEFFASRGFVNEPSRCPECRATRRSRSGDYGSGGYGGGGGGGYGRAERQMFPVTCSQCGKATEVPFQPREDRPVYCSDCYESRRTTGDSARRGGGGGGGGRSRW